MIVDLPLLHLDAPFGYRIPAELSGAVQPGVRVRVPFGGRPRVEGVVVAVHDEPPVNARDIVRVVSPLPVLTPELARLVRWLADRYAGALAEAARLVLPDRVAAVERELVSRDRPVERSAWAPPSRPESRSPRPGPLSAERPPAPGALGRLARRLESGRAGVVFWRALPGEDRAAVLAELVATAARLGRGAILVVPEVAAGSPVGDAVLARVPDALDLSAASSARERYRRWLAAWSGDHRVLLGGRSVVLGPGKGLGLVIVDDEANVALKEQRSPRYHAREVAIERGRRAGALVVLTGTVPSAEVVALLGAGACDALVPPRAAERAAAPRVEVVDPQLEGPLSSRVHPRALAVLRAALGRGESGFVLVPRRGAADPRHPGSRTTGQVAAELARRLPASGVWRLDRAVLEAGATPPWSPGEAGVVVGTIAGVKERPPIARCRTVVVVGADAALGQAEMSAAEQGLRAWARAAAWCGPRAGPGQMVLQAHDGGHHAVQALVRWDPEYFWERELPRRAALGFPPARRLILIEGDDLDQGAPVRDALARALEPDGEVVGPAPLGRGWRLIAKVPDPAQAALQIRPVLVEASRRGAPRLAIDVEPLEVLSGRRPAEGLGAREPAAGEPGGAP